MSRFLRRLGLFCLLQTVVAAVIFSRSTAPDADHYCRAILDKQKLLLDTPGRRIIFVGGSNVAFGIDSDCFRDQLGLQPVNMGLYAGLGLDFPLRQVAEQLRAGDVVIVSPEYRNLATSTAPSPEVQELVLACWPESARYFDADPPGNPKSFLDKQALAMLGERCRTGLAALARRGPKKPTVYRRSSFNQYGDVVAHHALAPRDVSKAAPLHDFSPAQLGLAIQRLNAFAESCQQRGAKAFFTYQPYPEKQFRESAAILRQVQQSLEAGLRIPILNRPEEVCFPLAYFFDSEDHLTLAGTQQRCERIIDGLSQQAFELARVPER